MSMHRGPGTGQGSGTGDKQSLFKSLSKSLLEKTRSFSFSKKSTSASTQPQSLTENAMQQTTAGAIAPQPINATIVTTTPKAPKKSVAQQQIELINTQLKQIEIKTAELDEILRSPAAPDLLEVRDLVIELETLVVNVRNNMIAANRPDLNIDNWLKDIEVVLAAVKETYNNNSFASLLRKDETVKALKDFMEDMKNKTTSSSYSDAMHDEKKDEKGLVYVSMHYLIPFFVHKEGLTYAPTWQGEYLPKLLEHNLDPKNAKIKNELDHIVINMLMSCYYVAAISAHNNNPDLERMMLIAANDLRLQHPDVAARYDTEVKEDKAGRVAVESRLKELGIAYPRARGYSL